MAWVFDWHGQDSRATGPLDVACTVTQTYGAGGGNTPMVVDVLCRASTQGGAESQMNTATTLTTDHDRTIIAHKTEAYRLVNAQYWGVPQRRRRVYACCDTGGRSADQILFERKGHGWNFEPCIPAGKTVAGIAGDGYRWHERMVAAKPAGGGMTPPTP